MSRVTLSYLASALNVSNQANCNAIWFKVGGRGGSPHFFLKFDAMGFRSVSDLSDYTVGELIDLIQKASEILKHKLTEEPAGQAVASAPADLAGAAGTAASGSSLKSPLTCESHCRICHAQRYRTTDHKLHACCEHTHPLSLMKSMARRGL